MPIYLILKKKKIHLLVEATGKSLPNASKVPSDPLPEKAIYQSSFHVSVVKQA